MWIVEEMDREKQRITVPEPFRNSGAISVKAQD